MSRRGALLLSAAALALGACAFYVLRNPPRTGSRVPPPPGTYAAQIDRLATADVEADVSAALARGDRRLMAVMGAGEVIPGVPDLAAHRQRYDREYGYRAIENTSDAIESEEHLRLQAAAVAYAEEYNELLLARRPLNPSAHTRPGTTSTAPARSPRRFRRGRPPAPGRADLNTSLQPVRAV